MSGQALVTGGGTGIGHAVAVELGARGYRVIVAGRRREPLERTAELVVQNGGTACVEILDVTKSKAVSDLVTGLARENRLSVVVANAGSFRRGSIAQQRIDDWSAQIDVNLSGAFYCIRAAFAAMQGQAVVEGCRGHIFTINSGAGIHGFQDGVGYAAAKHGLRGLVESVRPEAAVHDIKICDIVVSAMVESEMNAHRDDLKLPASTVAHTIASALQLSGAANWDRVDLSQLRP